ncbi:MAG TPA: PspC domain-containing protein [Pseudonocardiaceae bacterium]|nr:PspC domain-containing protein [Pseudonocardiaceae bacterium]
MSGNEQAAASPVAETAKDFWANRPRRPHNGRIVAGVAAGIGRRYGIDPIIVRVALVVATFYSGVGVLFYLLGWLLLPAEGDEVSPAEGLIGRGRTTASPGFTIVLGILLIPSASFVFDGDVSGYIAAAILLAALFLLHRGRAGHEYVVPPTTSAAQMPAGPGMPGQPTTAASTSTDLKGDPMSENTQWVGQPPVAEPTPPAWDPLGAAPFAWDLPEPQPTQQEPESPAPLPRRRSRIGLATFGITIAAAAALFASGSLSPQMILGVLVGIVGLGMVAGAFLGGGRGLIPLAAMLGCAGVLLTVTHIPNVHSVLGDANYAPTSIAQVQRSYQEGIGDLTLDLTGLPNSGTVTTSVTVDTGQAQVLVPSNADVVVSCHAGVGSVNCLDQHSDGANNGTIHTSQNDGSGNHNLKILLDVNSSIGDVEVSG